MKRETKPFLVEVKRGTRRTSFLGDMEQSSQMSEAQRRAEAVLFAPAIADAAPPLAPSEPSRRILQSLSEPIRVSDREDDEVPVQMPRHRAVGRPRKIPPTEAASTPVRPTASAPTSPFGFGLVEDTSFETASTSEGRVVEVGRLDEAPGEHRGGPTPGATLRLRDRSSILARYVLGTEPAPGERWVRPARRSERRARNAAD